MIINITLNHSSWHVYINGNICFALCTYVYVYVYVYVCYIYNIYIFIVCNIYLFITRSANVLTYIIIVVLF